MVTRYGRSPWIDSFPRSRVPAYPRQTGHVDADVAIVGGGLTGCATAYAFAAAGIKVALVEADRIARGSTGASAGWVADDPGTRFLDLEKTLGRKAARRAWQAWRRAALDFSALTRRLELKCRLEPQATLQIASTVEQAGLVKREHKARRDAGLEATLMNARAVADESGVAAIAGLRTRDGAALDPYRATLGLAAAAAKRGARLFERSAARRIAFRPKFVDVHTTAGTIRAERVVVATGVPTSLFASLIRHFWFHTAFFALTAPVPAALRHRLGRRAAVVRDASAPPHVLRWVDGAQLLVAGADASNLPARQRDKVVVQRTGQLMYELSTLYPEISGLPPAYGWSADYARTADGLPYIGPHRNYPRHLFAFGDSSHSVTGAMLASRILLRTFQDEAEPADEVFGFGR